MKSSRGSIERSDGSCEEDARGCVKRKRRAWLGGGDWWYCRRNNRKEGSLAVLSEHWWQFVVAGTPQLARTPRRTLSYYWHPCYCCGTARRRSSTIRKYGGYIPSYVENVHVGTATAGNYGNYSSIPVFLVFWILSIPAVPEQRSILFWLIWATFWVQKSSI